MCVCPQGLACCWANRRYICRRMLLSNIRTRKFERKCALHSVYRIGGAARIRYGRWPQNLFYILSAFLCHQNMEKSTSISHRAKTDHLSSCSVCRHLNENTALSVHKMYGMPSCCSAYHLVKKSHPKGA